MPSEDRDNTKVRHKSIIPDEAFGVPGEPNLGGRPVTLTRTLALEFQRLWQLAGEGTLSDAEIAFRTGVTSDQLNSWIRNNTNVNMEIDGNKPARLEGLRQIRTRARAFIKAAYISRLVSLSNKAEQKEDYRTAASITENLLAKQFPDFGKASETDDGGPKLVKLPVMVTQADVDKQKKNL